MVNNFTNINKTTSYLNSLNIKRNEIQALVSDRHINEIQALVSDRQINEIQALVSDRHINEIQILVSDRYTIWRS